MSRPQVTVSQIDTPPPVSIDTDTGKWLISVVTERGPLGPVEIRNMTQFVDTYGGRQSYSVGYDAAETFFREGGARLIVSRVVGPTPVKALKTLLDGSAGVTMTVTVDEYGSHANSWTIDVDVSGTDFSLIMAGTEGDGTAFSETVGPYATTAAAVAADAFTRATITQGASSLDPAATSPTAFASGTDDHANVTATQYTTALNLLTKDLGPGQVSIPGATSATLHAPLLAHALTHNRTPILDGVDSATIATVTSPAASDRAVDGAEFAGLFWPWATVPGLTSGTTRTVPYSAVEAGIIARNDSAGLSPNIAAAGDKGIAQWATGLSQAAPTSADWDTLANAGVNVARIYGGRVQTYGYDTLINPATDPRWIQLSGSRLNTLIAARADDIGEQFVFGELDVTRELINRFGATLTGMLLGLGQSVAAFNVDVGEGLNTEETMADGELNAAISYKAAPFAKTVTIQIAKRAFDEAVA